MVERLVSVVLAGLEGSAAQPAAETHTTSLEGMVLPDPQARVVSVLPSHMAILVEQVQTEQSLIPLGVRPVDVRSFITEYGNPTYSQNRIWF